MKKLALKFVTVILITAITSCSKDSIKEENITSLENKTAEEIKAIVTGNWKVHYAYGGLDGHTKQDFANKIFTVLPNDSAYLYSNNTRVMGDKITYHRTNTLFGYEAILLDFTTHLDWVVSRQKGDTLILKDHATEPFEYYLTKIPSPDNNN